MKILLTGSEGYIGVTLTQVLSHELHDVTGLDTQFYNNGWFYGKAAKPGSFIKKDVREVTEADVRGFDAVIHLAELSNDPLGQNNPQLTFDINHKGTVNLINSCLKAGVPRFIYSSSCSVYGASDDMSDETARTNPLTAYAKAKVLNEKYLLSQKSPAFAPIVLRNATVYGLSPRMRFDLAVNNLAGLAWVTGEIKMDSDGTPWRPFVHILDVCEAFRLALSAPTDKVSGQIFNVGDTRSNYQIKDIAKIIGRVFHVRKITLNEQGSDRRNYRVNFDKIRQVLGFKCLRDVKTGAQELLEIFQKVSLQKNTFFAKEYTRLLMIEHLKKNHKLNQQLYWI